MTPKKLTDQTVEEPNDSTVVIDQSFIEITPQLNNRQNDEVFAEIAMKAFKKGLKMDKVVTINLYDQEKMLQSNRDRVYIDL